MSFQHKLYNTTEIQLPRPEILFDENEKLLIIAIPWGPRGPVKEILNTITEYYLSSKGDHEITSPFQKLANMSTLANNLRVAALLANELILEKINKNEYHLGIELLIASFNQAEFVWLHSGRPYICLNRLHRPLLPLSVSLDLSNEFGSIGENLTPLPANLLGLNPHPNLFINNFRPQKDDQVVFISRSWIPTQLYNEDGQIRNLDSFSRALSDIPNTPYWLGVWDLFNNRPLS